MVAELIFKTFNNLLDKYLRGHRHLRSETMSNNTDTEFQPCVVLIGLACTTEKKNPLLICLIYYIPLMTVTFEKLFKII